MSIVMTNSMIDKYFGFLSKLDSVSKKRLIIKLTESIEESVKEKVDLKTLYGAWADSKSSDEIIKEIKNSRESSILKLKTGLNENSISA